MSAPSSIVESFQRQVKDRPAATALIVDRGRGYESLTWGQLGDEAEAAITRVSRTGIGRGERVLLWSENRFEWLIADLALQALGAVSVPLSPAVPAAQVAALIGHCQPGWAIVADSKQVAALLKIDRTGLNGIVRFAEGDEPSGTRIPVHGWTRLLQTAGAVRAQPTIGRLPERDETATIIYTSGTSGEPKGVMLSHGNLAFDAWATWTSFGNPPDERRFGLLPWTHAFARTCDLFAWIISGTQLIVGRSRETAIADMQATQPTYLNGVPYFFERVRQAIVGAGQGETHGAARALLGDALRACCSGGAPLPGETFDFFQQQRLPVLEGYGMTEASPVIATCTESAFRRGSVGRPLTGVEVRIAPDGEVLTRGPHVMQGYYRDAEATNATLVDGWLHTGDLGRLDDDGYLFLTGRKKDVIVLSTGRKISPASVESAITADPLFDQAVIVGNGQKAIAALLVLNEAQANTRQKSGSLNALVESRLRERLAGRPEYEQIRRFAILPRPLSVEGGELTAKLSLRRDVVASRYADLIKSLFEDER
jgi:long-chain acyl-CoA synthetase